MDDNAASKPPEEEEGFGEDGSLSESESETDSDEMRPVMSEDTALALAQALKVKEPESLIESEELQRQGRLEDKSVSLGDGNNRGPVEGDVSGGNLAVKFKGGYVELKDVNEQSLAECSSVKSKRDDIELEDVNDQSLAEFSLVKSKRDDVELKDVNEPSLAELASMKSKEDDVEPKNVNEQSLAEPEHVSPTFTHLTSGLKAEDDGNVGKNRGELKDSSPESQARKEVLIPMLSGGGTGRESPKLCFDNKGLGTVEEQKAFAKEVEAFYKEKHIDFKHPKFYKEDLNLLKLWRAVIELGGYEQVTACKLWRQVGESFNPPKTCTTVSWTFRNIYEKALLDYEKYKMHGGELKCPVTSFPESNGTANQAANNQTIGSGSGRARRDAAARAMRGWHSQGLLGNGEVCHPTVKEDKILTPPFKGLQKRKRSSSLEQVGPPQFKSAKPHLDAMVIDIGPPADWVKINVQKLNDCFEVYGLIPGLMRDEVHVQSDPVGRLVISGQPKELNNPWGVTPFKKVVNFPSRIDPQQISAVVTLHGQLFIRVPFEQMEQL